VRQFGVLLFALRAGLDVRLVKMHGPVDVVLLLAALPDIKIFSL